MAKRSIMSIQIDAEAKQNLVSVCARRGMSQIGVMSRLVNWFVGQEALIQNWVLSGESPEALNPMAQKLLKEIRAKKGR